MAVVLRDPAVTPYTQFPMNLSALSVLDAKMPVNSSVFNKYLSLLLFLVSGIHGVAAQLPPLDESQRAWLGDRIYKNECNHEVNCLTSWNSGENFLSLGIGHFIWYPEGQGGPFTETFPALVDFYHERGDQLPAWIEQLPGEDPGAPWTSRDEFYRVFDELPLNQLREFLRNTTEVQVDFMLVRLQNALPRMLATCPAAYQEDIEALFNRLAVTEPPYGIYALLDYINFKGEGTNPQESYQGAAWGLLQVLMEMLHEDGPGTDLEHFAEAAVHVLEQRVARAPPQRNEIQWLNGWRKRVMTYIPSP